MQVDQPAGGDGEKHISTACFSMTQQAVSTAVTGCMQVLKKLLESAKKREAEAAQKGAAKDAELEKLKVSSAVRGSTKGQMKWPRQQMAKSEGC